MRVYGELGDQTLTSGASTTCSGFEVTAENVTALDSEAQVSPEVEALEDGNAAGENSGIPQEKRAGLSVHDNLFNHAAERRLKLEDAQRKANKQLLQRKPLANASPGTEPLDPGRFDRLFEDHKLRQDKRTDKVSRYNETLKRPEDTRRTQKKTDAHGVESHYHDEESWARLLLPRSPKKPPEPPKSPEPKKKALQSNSEHRCLQLYNRSNENRQAKMVEEAVANDQKKETMEAKKKDRGCDMHHIQWLYEDHAVQQQRLHEKREQVRCDEEEAMMLLAVPRGAPTLRNMKHSTVSITIDSIATLSSTRSVCRVSMPRITT
jgi:hypothetical protein